jgi:hypothetical protein
MKMYGGVDVNGIHFGIAQKGLVIRVALVYPELLADLVEACLSSLADGVHVRVRVALIDGDELFAEAQADNCDIDFSLRQVFLLFRADGTALSERSRPST